MAITEVEIPRGAEIVERIYDTVADSTRWRQTLDTLCDLMEARLAVMGVLDTATTQARYTAASGDPALLEPLMSQYNCGISFFATAPVLEFDVAYTVEAFYALQGPGAQQRWLESEITRDWVIPNRLDDFFWLALMKQPARTAALVVMLDRQRRPISERDLQWMQALAPHIRRAVAIGDLFDEERAASDVFRQLVAALACPVLVVTHDMRVLFANQAAEALLKEGVVAQSTKGRLSFTDGHANASVQRTISMGVRDEVALGSAGINVPLALATAPAVAHVLPLARRDPEARFASNAAAGIFISVAGHAPPPAIEAIAALFGLTAGEKRVVRDVAEGKSRKVIALSHGVSGETIKTQLAAIFDKTGTSDQRQLEHLIRDVTPPVSAPSRPAQ